MNCSETKRLIDAYVDNELDLRGALEIEGHVARCPGCGAEERALRELQASARTNLSRYVPSPEFDARLRDALHAEGHSVPLHSEEASPALPRVARRRRHAWRWAALAPLAAAAALVVVAIPSGKIPILRTALPGAIGAIFGSVTRPRSSSLERSRRRDGHK